MVQEKALIYNGWFPLDTSSYASGEGGHKESGDDSAARYSVPCNLSDNEQAGGYARRMNKMVSWKDVQSSEQSKLVKWTTIKSVDRAFEKLYRSYNWDTEKLIDH